MTTNLRLAGFRGSFAGFEDALIWREPLVATADGLQFPNARWWNVDNLRPIWGDAATSFEIFVTAERAISPGQVVAICGRVHARRLDRIGVTLTDYFDLFEVHGYLVAPSSLPMYDRLVSDVAISAQRAFWKSISAGDSRGAESAARVLEQSPVVPRHRTYIALALLEIASGDPDAVDVVSEMAAVELGIPSSEFFVTVIDAWQRMSALPPINANAAEWRNRLSQEVKRLEEQFLPSIHVAQLTRPTNLAEQAAGIVGAFERSARQREPLRLEFGQLESSQRVWLPALALVGHQVADAGDEVNIRPYHSGRPLTEDEIPSGASQLLVRSGIGSAIAERQRRRLGNEERLFPSWVSGHTYRVLRHTRDDLVVADLHLPVDVVFVRDVLERLVPTWLMVAFPTAGDFIPYAERVIAELVKNVREHASLARALTSSSSLHLSATRGGGQESTDRLWIVVRDNGIGVRASLRRRARAELNVPPARLLAELLSAPGETEPALVRDATGAGDGLSDLATTCRQLSQRTGFPAELVLFSTSAVSDDSDGRECLVAQLQRPDYDQPSYGTIPITGGGSGTLAVVMIPTGSSAPPIDRRTTERPRQHTLEVGV